MVSHGDFCRVVRAQPVLSITYAYPQPGRSMSPEMTRRWQRFMVGVKQHEEKAWFDRP